MNAEVLKKTAVASSRKMIPSDFLFTSDEMKDAIDAAAKRAAEEVIRRLPAQPRPAHVTQKQAAEMLGISQPTVSKLVKSGALKLNKCGLIPIAEIDRAIQAVSRD
ncbi:MAG: helix-turn-helix domain-containing protein [Zoogloeaceae bacterium]|jgi:excisionase family DNA binding protein|nr:helix-turn-helix domain-containing protein [Zoogloeaceae bacterium]